MALQRRNHRDHLPAPGASIRLWHRSLPGPLKLNVEAHAKREMRLSRSCTSKFAGLDLASRLSLLFST